MLKLYKKVDNESHYWETWDKDEKTGIIHWGIVGERGQHKEVKSGFLSNSRKIIQEEIDQKIEEGYSEIEENDLCF